jgi:hypothetical protein
LSVPDEGYSRNVPCAINFISTLLLKNHVCINILIDKPDVTISESTSTFSGTGGGSVNIPCSYVSNPSATSVSWRKIQNSATTTITINGNKYAGGGLYQSGLTIYDLEASDVASYQCVATNRVGTGESESVQLIVDTKCK